MSFLIYATASGQHLDYVELFKYCAKRAYPEADIRVDEFYNVPVPYYASCVRFLSRPGEHDYVYTTDVDMMLLHLKPSAYEYHTEKMQETGLCYSNTPRKNEVMGPDRLTGLHFASKEWYQRTEARRKLCMEVLNKGMYGNSRTDDERMLMKIARMCEVGVPPRHGLISMHFGIHLGTVRAYHYKSRETMKQQLAMRISPEYAKQWCSIIDEPGFQKIAVESCRASRILRDELMTVESFCRGRAKE